jgi:hypothetical protein
VSAVRSSIVIRSRSDGTHFWGAAPGEVEFLRYPHRHEFHTTVTIDVEHDDRELEFFMVKRRLAQVLPHGDMGGKSCEMMARDILKSLRSWYGDRRYTIEVSEDGENSAVLEFAP